MPISRKVIYKCPKCGYKITKIIGDVIMPNDLFVKCPKCGTMMKQVKEYSLIDIIKNLFK